MSPSASQTDRPPAPVPSRPSQAGLRRAVQGCQACDLWEGATQAVIGEGAAHASLMLVGEQPGDKEDLQGHPFVGPAGGVLDRGLQEAGVCSDDVYITNVVKHFRYKARGKRRIHQKPDRWHVSACLPWLEAELGLVKPAALVLLGATAAQALLGSHIRIGRDRGTPVDSELAELVTLTAHPSSILRSQTEQERAEAMAQFVADLKGVARWLRAR
jgi:uracil-DNA glycosylase family protein